VPLGEAEGDRTDHHDYCGGDRESSPRRALAASPRGGDGRRWHAPALLPLLAERAQDTVAELGRRLLIVNGPGQRRDALFELHPLVTAGDAPSQVPPDLEVLASLERAKQVLGQ
jgi:hypothetical protein